MTKGKVFPNDGLYLMSAEILVNLSITEDLSDRPGRSRRLFGVKMALRSCLTDVMGDDWSKKFWLSPGQMLVPSEEGNEQIMGCSFGLRNLGMRTGGQESQDGLSSTDFDGFRDAIRGIADKLADSGLEGIKTVTTEVRLSCSSFHCVNPDDLPEGWK